MASSSGGRQGAKALTDDRAVGLWFVFQLISAFGVIGQGPQSGGGVAFMAHIGGFIAGAVLVLVFAVGSRPAEPRDRPQLLGISASEPRAPAC